MREIVTLPAPSPSGPCLFSQGQGRGMQSGEIPVPSAYTPADVSPLLPHLVSEGDQC